MNDTSRQQTFTSGASHANEVIRRAAYRRLWWVALGCVVLVGLVAAVVR